MRDAWYDDLVNRQGQVPFAVDDDDQCMIGRIFLRFVNRVEGGSVLGNRLRPALRAAKATGPMHFRRFWVTISRRSASTE